MSWVDSNYSSEIYILDFSYFESASNSRTILKYFRLYMQDFFCSSVLDTSSIWTCRILNFEHLFWFFQLHNKQFQNSTFANVRATKGINLMSFQSSFKIRKVDDLTWGQAKSTITLAQISGFNIYCIFMIGTLLNGCNPEIPECGLSARRIVGGVDAAPGIEI